MKRRKFIQSSILASALSSSVLSLGYAGSNRLEKNPSIYREPARDIPIIDEYEVVVAGAGPAGIAAAIESGRNGAKTLLIESHGCLGGIWTSGLLTWILDQSNKGGLMAEIKSRLIETGGKSTINIPDHSYSFDPEKMKLLLEEMATDAGVDILLHTSVVAAVKNHQNRLSHIITESKSGREAWVGNLFIDTTGDGDLAARAGCGFDFGNENGMWQPFSMLALVTGLDIDEIKPYTLSSGNNFRETKRLLLEKMVNGGVIPSYLKPALHPIRENLFMIMANHEYEYKGFDARDVTKATLHARKELHKIINALKSHGGPWKNMQLIATAEQIGVREGRRIHGLYTVSKEDLIEGSRFDDAVCRVTFGVDVHSTTKDDEEKGGGYNQGIKSKDYDIPLRSLVAKDVGGLMMAGRCISGDFIAHSSYRVTGNAVAMGEAAGKVAAIAAKKNKMPQDVSLEEAGVTVNSRG